jgi:hypothetical protein
MGCNRPGLRFFLSRSAGSKLVSGARRLPQPAAGPANGGGSELLSVVPQILDIAEARVKRRYNHTHAG